MPDDDVLRQFPSDEFGAATEATPLQIANARANAQRTGNNEVLGNLGANEPFDPFAIAPFPDVLRQGIVRDKVVSAAVNLHTTWETLPLYVESFLLATLVDLFRQDEAFPYNPDNEMDSRILITTSWNRGVIEGRDRKPMIVVAFQSAQADSIWLRDMHLMTTPQFPMAESKGATDTMRFRITVLHHNRNLALFLGQQVRVLIAELAPILREVFRLQQVSLPSISGPGQIDEFPDLYGAFIDLQIMAVPKWKVKRDPIWIKRIIIETIGTAQDLIAGAILQEQIVINVETPDEFPPHTP
jgi:hypothetical protein